MVGPLFLLNQFLATLDTPFDWRVVMEKSPGVVLQHATGCKVWLLIHPTTHQILALDVVGPIPQVGLVSHHLTPRTVEAHVPLLPKTGLSMLDWSPFDPVGAIERVCRGINRRGRLGWMRLEQILKGSILLQCPKAQGPWEVGLHPDLRSAQGPTSDQPNTPTLLPLFQPIRFHGLVLDLPSLLMDFLETIGPVRLWTPGGIVSGLHTPLTIPLSIPADTAARRACIDSVIESACAPDVFV